MKSMDRAMGISNYGEMTDNQTGGGGHVFYKHRRTDYNASMQLIGI